MQPGDLDAAMVRRLKSDLRETIGGLPLRHVIQVDVDGLPADAPELVDTSSTSSWPRHTHLS